MNYIETSCSCLPFSGSVGRLTSASLHIHMWTDAVSKVSRRRLWNCLEIAFLSKGQNCLHLSWHSWKLIFNSNQISTFKWQYEYIVQWVWELKLLSQRSIWQKHLLYKSHCVDYCDWFLAADLGTVYRFIWARLLVPKNCEGNLLHPGNSDANCKCTKNNPIYVNHTIILSEYIKIIRLLEQVYSKSYNPNICGKPCSIMSNLLWSAESWRLFWNQPQSLLIGQSQEIHDDVDLP